MVSCHSRCKHLCRGSERGTQEVCKPTRARHGLPSSPSTCSTQYKDSYVVYLHVVRNIFVTSLPQCSWSLFSDD